ncbi:MAG: phosphoribosylaminoimidazolesuccinocarboxamide synthase [Deltaproteobacteria bacterium]|nr:phosphoribosylaminoimidazolesuccinocarboxamide synthase [Deltaproteobacteria bacterium]
MEKKEKIYEGKAKILYATNDPNYVVQYFKDDATAFNAQKKGTIVNKGIMNNKISAVIFKFLEKNKIPTHFVEKLSDRDMLVRKVSIVPLEVVVRNKVAGSLAKRLGMTEGQALKTPVLEFFYKDDALGDPMISESCALAFEWAKEAELNKIKTWTWKINSLLQKFFDERGVELIDFKLEFGKDAKGKMYLADEISPDGCRLWEKGTGEKLDKDRFRRDLGKVEESYEKVCQLICG